MIKELSKSDKEAKETKKQFSEKIKSMKQELEKAKREVEESKKTLEEYENKANYEVAEKQKVELEYKKKLQAMETKLQALKRKQKVWVEFKYLCCNTRLNRRNNENNKGVNNIIFKGSVTKFRQLQPIGTWWGCANKAYLHTSLRPPPQRCFPKHLKIMGTRKYCSKTIGCCLGTVGTLRSNDAMAAGTSLKKGICVLSVFIPIIPTHLLCQL